MQCVVNFRISPYLFEQLEIISKKVGITKSELVRTSVLYFIMNFDKQIEKDFKTMQSR